MINNFNFWGDYEEDYAADSVNEGFAEVVETFTRKETHPNWTGTGTTLVTKKIAKIRVTKPGFKRPGPYDFEEIEVGTFGECPAGWVE